MAGKAEDRSQGLAERSLNTSIVHPTEGNSGHRIRTDRSAADRRLEENGQREGMDKADRASPQSDDRTNP